MVSGGKNSCKSNINLKGVGYGNKIPSYLKNEKGFATISLWVLGKSLGIFRKLNCPKLFFG